MCSSQVFADRRPGYSLWGRCHPSVWGGPRLRSTAAHLLPDSALASGPLPGCQLCSLEPQGAGASGLLQWWWGDGLLEVSAAWRPLSHLDFGQNYGSPQNVIKTFLAQEDLEEQPGLPLTWLSRSDLVDVRSHMTTHSFPLLRGPLVKNCGRTVPCSYATDFASLQDTVLKFAGWMYHLQSPCLYIRGTYLRPFWNYKPYRNNPSESQVLCILLGHS